MMGLPEESLGFGLGGGVRVGTVTFGNDSEVV